MIEPEVDVSQVEANMSVFDHHLLGVDGQDLDVEGGKCIYVGGVQDDGVDRSVRHHPMLGPKGYDFSMIRRRLEQTAGWPGFLAFLLAGGLLSFGIVGAASVGLFVLPLGVVLFGLLVGYAPDPRDRWGVLAGVGAVVVFVGVLHRNYQPCEAGWVLVPQGEEGLSSCGGLDGRLWLVVGLLFIVTSLILYRRRRAGAAASNRA